MELPKKVLLISLRSPFLDSDRIYFPMGLLYLASALKERGHQVDIEDDFNGSKRRIKDYSNYDFIGLTLATPQKEQAKEILRWLKNQSNKKKNQRYVVGGPHANFYTDEILKEGWDYVVKGDGERVIIDIVEGKAKRGLSQDFLKQGDFDKLPKPDRLGYSEIIKEYSHTFNGPQIKATTFLSGRGCPMSCKFCEGARTPIRWTSIEKTKKELDDIQALGFNAVYVIDDLFTISPIKIKPYAEEFKKRGIIYRCNAHAKFMTPEFASLLADTGCFEVGIGVESGSQKILDAVGKNVTVKQCYDAIKMLKDRGIRVRAFFMLGLPGETLETIAETENFIQKAGMDDFQLTVYAPYKGTQIRDEIDKGCKDIDLLIEGEPSAHTQKDGRGESKVRTKALSSEDILKERDRLIRTYKPASHTFLRTNPEYSKTIIEKTHS